MPLDNHTKRIYLDHAASTPIDTEVLTHLLHFFGKEYGNASSMYLSGRKSKQALDDARREVAHILNASPEEIIFTGSGTEADNLALYGVAEACKAYGKHIIISAVEHKAVYEAAKKLSKLGWDISYIPVDHYGVIDSEACISLIRKDTVLISVMYANNEIGSVQPIAELAKQVNELKHGHIFPLIHTDACQAPGFLPLNVEELGVDLLTLNGSKIYGPKGIGMLYRKTGTPLAPLIVGGDQERLMRAGTESLPLICGFARALTKVINQGEEESKRLQTLQKYFISELKKKIPSLILNGHPITRLPNNIHISIPAIEGESMVLMLDKEGIEVATGSACSTFDLKPSHVLIAIGQNADIIHGSLRFSFGKNTTHEDLVRVLDIFPKIVHHLISISAIRNN